jgi:hypothetical protein
MLWFLSGLGGGGFGGGSGGGGSSKGSAGSLGSGTLVPRGPPNQQSPAVPNLPAKADQAVNSAYNDLKTYEPDQRCIDRVISKIDNFSYTDFQASLTKGANFYDGTQAGVMAASVFPNAAAAHAGVPAGVLTVSEWFSSSPGMNAPSSTSSAVMTVYFRPSAISLKNVGRNRALLFHEGLHAFGGGQYSFSDEGLQTAFRLQQASRVEI